MFRDKKSTVNNDLLNVWSSVGELRKYVYAINECVFLDCESLKSSSKLWVPVNWRNSFAPPHGLAWFVSETKDKDHKISYEGIINGFRTTLIMYPQEKIIAIILSNNSISYSESVVKRLINLNYIK